MNEDTSPLMVTIRCITYNHEPYIRQCLEGFVMQKTNFHFEAIVHDDASTDGTAIVIKEYAEKYPDIIKPIFETENQYSKYGGFGALTKIMDEHTYGKYVAFCEGDDYWIDPLKLQKQVDFMENHPDFSMCFHRAKILKEIDVEVGLKCEDIEYQEYFPDEFVEKWKVPTASIMARKEYLDVKNVGTERILNEDSVIILNCAKIGRIWGMNDTMSVYRVQNSGVTYDEHLKRERCMKYPAHFKFIKANYPFINHSLINRKIARAHIDRRKMHNSIFLFIKDIIMAFYYCPKIYLEKFICMKNRCPFKDN